MGNSGLQTLAKSPEEAKKRREADEAYESQGKNFDDNKTNLKKSLGYGDFDGVNPQEYEDTGEEPKREEATEGIDGVLESVTIKTKENPNYPLIVGFEQAGILNSEEANELKGGLAISTDFREQVLSSYLPEDKKEQLIQAIDYVGGEEQKKSGTEKFNKDFSVQIEGIKKENPEDKKAEKQLTEKDQHLVEKLGGNYFAIGKEGEKNETKQEGLDRAFSITLNEIIDGKQFKRPDTFEEMKAIVNDTNLDFEERFNQLRKISILVDDDQSRANGKQSKSFQNTKKGVEAKERTIEQRFNDYKAQLEKAIQNDNNEKINEIKEGLKELSEEAESEGDMFTASEIEAEINDIEGMSEAK